MINNKAVSSIFFSFTSILLILLCLFPILGSFSLLKIRSTNEYYLNYSIFYLTHYNYFIILKMNQSNYIIYNIIFTIRLFPLVFGIRTKSSPQIIFTQCQRLLLWDNQCPKKQIHWIPMYLIEVILHSKKTLKFYQNTTNQKSTIQLRRFPQ